MDDLVFRVYEDGIDVGEEDIVGPFLKDQGDMLDWLIEEVFTGDLKRLKRMNEYATDEELIEVVRNFLDGIEDGCSAACKAALTKFKGSLR